MEEASLQYNSRQYMLTSAENNANAKNITTKVYQVTTTYAQTSWETRPTVFRFLQNNIFSEKFKCFQNFFLAFELIYSQVIEHKIYDV